MRVHNYMVEAQEELDRADAWANKDNVERETRELLVRRSLDRALILSLLAIAQKIEAA